MTFTKILCPTDFSAGAEQALRTATQLASQTGAELVVLHSWYLPPTAYRFDIPISPEVTQEMVDDAQGHVDAAVRACLAGGAKRASGRLVSGIPWTEIVQLLEREAFDLCVIGTHGRTGVRRILLGSVAENVIRHAPCPVLAIHPNDTLKALSNLLVPTDFSESAADAVGLAARLVRPDGTLTLLHAVERPGSVSGEISIPGFEVEVRQQAEAALKRDAAALQGKTNARVQWRVETGSAAVTALDAIEKDPTIDLVVMGSHGRTGIKRILLGSVAEKIVRHAERPVLVARKRR